MEKRLFLAVNVSEQTRALIRALQSEFHFLKNEIRFIAPGNVHLTLKFLGDVNTDHIPAIILKIKSSIHSFKNFVYIIQGTGVFPNLSRPRILWLGITQGSNYLGKLSKLLNDALKDMPVKKEDREYRSHITLGRVKGFKKSYPNLNRFVKYRFDPIKNNVAEIILFESILKPKGAIYTPIHKFILN
jgi:2'-5' RNA ligase